MWSLSSVQNAPRASASPLLKAATKSSARLRRALASSELPLGPSAHTAGASSRARPREANLTNRFMEFLLVSGGDSVQALALGMNVLYPVRQQARGLVLDLDEPGRRRVC